MNRFGCPVTRRRQPRVDPRSLVVQQHRVLDQRRKHAALFEADDEGVRTAVPAGTCERGHVQVAWPGPVAADGRALKRRAHYPDDLDQGPLHVAHRRELVDGHSYDLRGRAVERCELTGALEHERPGR